MTELILREVGIVARATGRGNSLPQSTGGEIDAAIAPLMRDVVTIAGVLLSLDVCFTNDFRPERNFRSDDLRKGFGRISDSIHA